MSRVRDGLVTKRRQGGLGRRWSGTADHRLDLCGEDSRSAGRPTQSLRVPSQVHRGQGSVTGPYRNLGGGEPQVAVLRGVGQRRPTHHVGMQPVDQYLGRPHPEHTRS
jgi:hypothetical protein